MLSEPRLRLIANEVLYIAVIYRKLEFQIIVFEKCQVSHSMAQSPS